MQEEKVHNCAILRVRGVRKYGATTEMNSIETIMRVTRDRLIKLKKFDIESHRIDIFTGWCISNYMIHSIIHIKHQSWHHTIIQSNS